MTQLPFQLWPAIDIIDGKPVRLFKGDYSQKTEYSNTFESLAKTFSEFAFGVHIIDLDGAKEGKPVNINAIEVIIDTLKSVNSNALVEVGGGIRNLENLETLFNIGVSRCIIGTSALNDPKFLAGALKKYSSEKIIVGVDCRNRKVATHGWETESNISDVEFITTLEKLGIKIINYTDISTDGTLEGSAIEIFNELHAKFPNITFIGSGGIATIDDIQEVKNTEISGIIFGKAFYEKRITIDELNNFNTQYDTKFKTE
ncbi:TPA: 1-(5-phosphoribosyl)-5-[(5-phosphoribosylamino)methylideneamino]imidazole-4-carboxamide isomerase [Candidatus Gracilibacteria bacterium]|nr:1-(5-phosphoribosyl)-5-[(5-phosphoribosylamino)methylideneamino]imidazole-4-carboxamide isomerase [Candidatus Peregrinibacteria bacterium]HIQ56791.1 1-(5-phosphoribosyl)-5-[(5-phosphoribosylamino)methylideneamino]imidazole-4-carboxamide isomerase [Candidatus Gracilibacteria bacterium]HIQ57106.1 1-(5-phosphoribosyl)-5-[(5-phosphoribosylamino)methylideneamino]imidazole-4-carboxamide isomerase [Candidatus Gracilibacteria bacterium]